MICQRCKQSRDNVQTYKTDLDEPAEVTLCTICKEVYGTLSDGEGGVVVLYYPESQDLDLLDMMIEEGLFRTPAAIARFLGHQSPSHLYRVRKGEGNLSERDREALINHWRETHQPSPVFCPAIEDTMPGRRTLILPIEGGEELRIPLSVQNGRWVVVRNGSEGV